MSDSNEKFATALCCMDGRAVEAVKNYILEHYGIRFVDFITEPGMDNFLHSCSPESYAHIEDKMVRISVGHHGSRLVVKVGHDDCAGFPVEKEKHLEAIKKGVSHLAELNFGIDEPVTILGLWVEKKPQSEWTAELITSEEK